MEKRTISFDTSKLTFKDGFDSLRCKELLYRFYTYEEIEEWLKEKGIIVDHNVILQEYQQCYDLEELMEKYRKKYQKKLDRLDDEMILLDADCLFLYFNRIIEENLDVMDLPDVSYIDDQIDAYLANEGKEKIDMMIRILKNINKMRQYRDDDDLVEMFRRIDMDIEWFLDDEIGVEVHNARPNLRQSRELYKEVMKLVDNYKLDFPYQHCSDVLDILAEHSYDKVKKELAECVAKYPEYKIRFYVGVLTSLIGNPMNSEISKKLIDEIQSTPPVSQDDYDYLDILKEWTENTEFDEKKKLLN